MNVPWYQEFQGNQREEIDTAESKSAVLWGRRDQSSTEIFGTAELQSLSAARLQARLVFIPPDTASSEYQLHGDPPPPYRARTPT